MIKDRFPGIKNLEYLSDGCADQYKNYKNMLNLCLHNSDFRIGVTVKRLAALAK